MNKETPILFLMKYFHQEDIAREVNVTNIPDGLQSEYEWNHES